MQDEVESSALFGVFWGCVYLITIPRVSSGPYAPPQKRGAVKESFLLLLPPRPHLRWNFASIRSHSVCGALKWSASPPSPSPTPLLSSPTPQFLPKWVASFTCCGWRVSTPPLPRRPFSLPFQPGSLVMFLDWGVGVGGVVKGKRGNWPECCRSSCGLLHAEPDSLSRPRALHLIPSCNPWGHCRNPNC